MNLQDISSHRVRKQTFVTKGTGEGRDKLGDQDWHTHTPRRVDNKFTQGTLRKPTMTYMGKEPGVRVNICIYN